MPSFPLTTTIHAPIDRVWRALCDPTEVTQWDATVLEALDAPPDYPQPGQHVRWRIAEATPIIASPASASPLRKRGRGQGEGSCTTTLSTSSLQPFSTPTSPFIARLHTLPQSRTAFATSLANLKRHCEQDP